MRPRLNKSTNAKQHFQKFDFSNSSNNYFQFGLAMEDVEDETRDPISFEIMTDPVVTEEGFTYDRKTIEEWFANKGPVSPSTGAALGSTKLTPNHSVRNIITRKHPGITLAPFTPTTAEPAATGAADSIQRPVGQAESARSSSWSVRWPRFGNWGEWSYSGATRSQPSQGHPPSDPASNEAAGRELLSHAISSLQHRDGATGADVAPERAAAAEDAAGAGIRPGPRAAAGSAGDEEPVTAFPAQGTHYEVLHVDQVSAYR